MALDRIAHYQDKPKGVMNTEQLNIEGKRSGEGFVVHKSRLVDALIRADAERIDLIGLTVGRRGFLACVFRSKLGHCSGVKVGQGSGLNWATLTEQSGPPLKPVTK